MATFSTTYVHDAPTAKYFPMVKFSRTPQNDPVVKVIVAGKSQLEYKNAFVDSKCANCECSIPKGWRVYYTVGSVYGRSTQCLRCATQYPPAWKGTLDPRKAPASKSEPESAPAPVRVKPKVEIPKGKPGQHRMLAEMLVEIQDFSNILLKGPSGSGKTYLVGQLAQELNREFCVIACSEGLTEAKLFGSLRPQANGSWDFVPSEFVTTYEAGGVILLDEFDGAEATVALALNAALANGYIPIPGGKRVMRHKDTLIFAATNTWGTGAGGQYSGRQRLDGATLDRFSGAMFEVEYDLDLEMQIARDMCDNAAPAIWVHGLRDKVTNLGLAYIVSTRMVVSAARLFNRGLSKTEIINRLTVSWSVDDRSRVI